MSAERLEFERREPRIEHDDIERLRESIDMPSFPYVDFSARQRYRQALARWPLLREAEALRAHADSEEEAEE